jgi:hypothetical protein
MEGSGEVIKYMDCEEIDCTDFSAYLSLPGYSHSYLKSQKGGVTPSFNVTDKIMTGKIVDQILTNSGKVDFAHPQYKKASIIAQFLKQHFESILPQLKTQVAFTGRVEFAGLFMTVKGILDYLLPKFAVIDLKITAEKNVDKLIEFMGYKNQLWNYARLAGVKFAYILIYSTHKDNQKYPCRLIKIDVSEPCNAFWKNAILDFGEVAA